MSYREYQKISIWTTTKHRLKIAAALRGVSMLQLLDEMVSGLGADSADKNSSISSDTTQHGPEIPNRSIDPSSGHYGDLGKAEEREDVLGS